MEFRSFMGKYYLTSSDWREINSTVADIQDYYKEIQAEIRRQEELKRQQELERERKRQNELQRKHAREYLETIEELLEEEIEEEEPEENADVHMSPISSDDFQGRFSIAASELSNYDAYDEINLSSFRDAYYGAGMTRSIPMDMTFTEKLLHLMRISLSFPESPQINIIPPAKKLQFLSHSPLGLHWKRHRIFSSGQDTRYPTVFLGTQQ